MDSRACRDAVALPAREKPAQVGHEHRARHLPCCFTSRGHLKSKTQDPVGQQVILCLIFLGFLVSLILLKCGHLKPLYLLHFTQFPLRLLAFLALRLDGFSTGAATALAHGITLLGKGLALNRSRKSFESGFT